MTRSLTLVAVALVSAALPARAQSPTRQVTPSPSTVQTQSTVPDVLFAAAAGSGGLAELNLSQIGLQKATDLQLKQFSQRMIDDHTKLNQQLTNEVTRKGIRIPAVIDARAQFCVESLSGLSGEEFDKCYAKAQFVMHMDAVATFEAEARRGQDPDIKALAASALPIIKDHLKTIKPIVMQYEKEKSEDQDATRAGHTQSSR